MIAITSRVVGTWCHRRRDKKKLLSFYFGKIAEPDPPDRVRIIRLYWGKDVFLFIYFRSKILNFLLHCECVPRRMRVLVFVFGGKCVRAVSSASQFEIQSSG